MAKSIKNRLVISAVAALVATACLFGLLPGSKVEAQNAGQVITAPVGNELVQVYPPNTAAIAYMSTSSLRDGRFYVYNVPLTGFSITMTVDQSAVSLNPAGTLAAGTIIMPPTTVDGKIVTIYTTQTITALTLSTSNSATFAPAAVTTLAANATVGYVYDKANNQWHRIQ